MKRPRFVDDESARLTVLHVYGECNAEHTRQLAEWQENVIAPHMGRDGFREDVRLQAHFEQAQIIFREGRPGLLRLRASNPDDGSERERKRETPPSSATSAAAHPLEQAQ